MGIKDFITEELREHFTLKGYGSIDHVGIIDESCPECVKKDKFEQFMKDFGLFPSCYAAAEDYLILWTKNDSEIISKAYYY